MDKIATMFSVTQVFVFAWAFIGVYPHHDSASLRRRAGLCEVEPYFGLSSADR